jgi:hypothetical protein
LLEAWKVPHLVKGCLTWVPFLNAWRMSHASTGGTDSARYCYSVWLRHLITLHIYGFQVKGAHIGELGPGESIGIGLAALLSGAAKYVGLDIVPFSSRANLESIFDELVQLYSHREIIPHANEFPLVRPRLDSYEFPNQLIDWSDFSNKASTIRDDLRSINNGQFISYHAPWTSLDDVSTGTLDLIFSQAVMEHVDALQETYAAMSTWLKPGGYASHVIDFGAHGRSPFWNGHWAYSDLEWTLARGRREFFLNRQPSSAHVACARKVGFEILALKRDYVDNGLNKKALARRFQTLDCEDVRTRGTVLVLKKRG